MNKLITEFIGTFFLVLAIGLSVGADSPAAPYAITAVLIGMIYMGGYISMAHYNPAATLGFFLQGRIGKKEAILFVTAQVLASIAAATCAVWMLGGHAISPSVGTGYGILQALVAEFLFTFALILVILNVALPEAVKGNSYYGLAIGLTVLAGILTVGAISGAAFNPAVAIGLTVVDVVAGDGSFVDFWIYLVGPLSGAAAASFVFDRQGAGA